jgi:hypothetical protein
MQDDFFLVSKVVLPSFLLGFFKGELPIFVLLPSLSFSTIGIFSEL